MVILILIIKMAILYDGNDYWDPDILLECIPSGDSRRELESSEFCLRRPNWIKSNGKKLFCFEKNLRTTMSPCSLPRFLYVIIITMTTSMFIERTASPASYNWHHHHHICHHCHHHRRHHHHNHHFNCSPVHWENSHRRQILCYTCNPVSTQGPQVSWSEWWRWWGDGGGGGWHWWWCWWWWCGLWL